MRDAEEQEAVSGRRLTKAQRALVPFLFILLFLCTTCCRLGRACSCPRCSWYRCHALEAWFYGLHSGSESTARFVGTTLSKQNASEALMQQGRCTALFQC